MRLLFGCLAVVLGAVSISLAARYGYKGADTTIDGVISAVVFGSIALCAFIFDAAAVRLWFMRHHVGRRRHWRHRRRGFGRHVHQQSRGDCRPRRYYPGRTPQGEDR